MATHSPILLSYPRAQIFTFDGEQIGETSYEKTRNYRLYEQFFRDRDSLISD